MGPTPSPEVREPVVQAVPASYPLADTSRVLPFDADPQTRARGRHTESALARGKRRRAPPASEGPLGGLGVRAGHGDLDGPCEARSAPELSRGAVELDASLGHDHGAGADRLDLLEEAQGLVALSTLGLGQLVGDDGRRLGRLALALGVGVVAAKARPEDDFDGRAVVRQLVRLTKSGSPLGELIDHGLEDVLDTEDDDGNPLVELRCSFTKSSRAGTRC